MKCTNIDYKEKKEQFGPELESRLILSCRELSDSLSFVECNNKALAG